MKDHTEQADPVSGIRSQFSDFNETDFVHWLDNGFRAYYSARRKEAPFSFASLYIARLDDIVDDIGFIYRELIPSEQQPLFRSSIGKLLLRSVTSVDFPKPAVSDLIDLVAEVEAHESLLCLPQVVAAGRYGKERQSLQYEAIGVIKQLLPSREAVESLRDLITAPDFNCRFSFDILTALCRHDSVNWMEHVALLSNSIDNMYRLAVEHGTKEVRDVSEAYLRFQKIFVESVPVSMICRAIIQSEDKLSSMKRYERCIHLIRQLEERDNSPVYITYTPIRSKDQRGAYRISIAVIEKEPVRAEDIIVSDHYYYVLFIKQIGVVDGLLHLEPNERHDFEEIYTDLTNHRYINQGEAAEVS